MLRTLYDHIHRWLPSIKLGPVELRPPKAERSTVLTLITKLGDRRLLTALECRVPRCDMIESCNIIRKNVTDALNELGAASPSRAHLVDIRIAAHNFQKFMEEHLDGEEYKGEVEVFFIELGELRGITGRCLAEICGLNDIEVERDLKHLLPSSTEQVV